MPLSAGPLAHPDRARGERRQSLSHVPRPTCHAPRPRPPRSEERAAAGGHALTEQEPAEGLGSLAVPVRDARGRVVAAVCLGSGSARSGDAHWREVAALNVAPHTGRGTAGTLRREPLPAPRATAPRIAAGLATASAQLPPGAFRSV
ncbi:IclR family transcriptional regulator C-terminal domain-containing protein [Streptomyces hygroscopicus]|uniref:IclR family transcriptional regulator C-terminal domain-containing protein n=1 Tax=Streptomyces hygroscopicus TaxID=1912 RepID=UPI00099E7057|nr:IclR family transcriptional regulator C-terminal domain-containing protein [Streptomyces hygroscopicus]GLV74202.1 hypothetical protein Shyhy02_22040 [Streptomyces hygroscopicus subsp. hygroscopicus]